jgi:hypothetical protein
MEQLSKMTQAPGQSLGTNLTMIKASKVSAFAAPIEEYLVLRHAEFFSREVKPV